MGNSTVHSLFFGGTILTSKQPAIPGYQNITLDGSIITLYSSNITCHNSFVTFDGSLLRILFLAHMALLHWQPIPHQHIIDFLGKSL